MQPERISDSFNNFDSQSSAANILPIEDAHLDDLLRECAKRGASDVHLSVGLPPMLRIDGSLHQTNYTPIAPNEAQRLIYDILTNEQVEKYERTHELDFSYGVKGIGRYRVNVYKQRGSVGAAMRSIPDQVPSFEQLGLPPIIQELCKKHSGLVLITGPTGSGKSTTLACMIDTINSERPLHIMTMEDPIEYLHRHKRGMVNQRELGADTDSFNNALRAVLREDPDVVLIGEMRDLETIQAALTLAETGHLVLGTLHTRSAPQTVDRIVDVFPPHQQDQIRVQLSNALEAVIAQQLLPRNGGGRCVAIEILIATSAIRNLIREDKTHQIYGSLETGSKFGMQTMDKMLVELYQTGKVSHEDAIARCIDKENFKKLLSGG
ncbi:MAG: type IV pilus twitching motility protein PilT [Armatimonadetes bacterium]|nr:type IV pilus twitching motility protein PilT [Armatimonadota bacterium]